MSHPSVDTLMSLARAHARPWYDPDHPEISIIVLNFNQAELSKLCLLKIWLNTSGVRYEIILVDNGSSSADFAALVATPGPFTLLRLKTNRYFGEGNNIGVERAKGRFIVLLNNDAFVEPGWLLPLLYCQARAWKAGGVGPKFVYPGGRMQELGSFIDETGEAVQVGKTGFYEPEDTGAPRIVDYCSAACFLISKKLFLEIGGFDFAYEPAYYEDTDLCFKIAARGHYIYCCPDSCVVHVERATTAVNAALVGGNLLANNKDIFLARWGDALARRAAGQSLAPHGPNRGIQPVQTGRSAPRPAAMAIAFALGYDLVPREKLRMLLAGAAYLSQTYAVTLLTPDPCSRLRLEALGQALSLDLTRVGLSDSSDVGAIDLCITASDRGLSLPPCRGTRNILVCDIAACREPADPQDIRNEAPYPIDERLTFSPFCRDHLEFWADEAILTHLIPVPIEAGPLMLPRDQAGALQILTIGRFRSGPHSKRQDIAIEAVRRLTQQGHAIELHIAGWLLPEPDHRHYFASLQRMAAGLPIHFHPNAPAATLAHLLRRAALYWHMTGFGIDPALEPQRCEAFGISILDAMAAGCVPLVVASGGPTHVIRDGVTGFTYRSLDELTDKTGQLLDDPGLRLSIAQAARGAAHSVPQAQFRAGWDAIVARHRLHSDQRLAPPVQDRIFGQQAGTIRRHSAFG